MTDQQIIKHLMEENKALRKIIENITRPATLPSASLSDMQPFVEDKKEVAKFMEQWDRGL